MDTPSQKCARRARRIRSSTGSARLAGLDRPGPARRNAGSLIRHLQLDGALPRTPARRSRGPLRPAPLLAGAPCAPKPLMRLAASKRVKSSRFEPHKRLIRPLRPLHAIVVAAAMAGAAAASLLAQAPREIAFDANADALN